VNIPQVAANTTVVNRGATKWAANFIPLASLNSALAEIIFYS
jgi:hypothetical protein